MIVTTARNYLRVKADDLRGYVLAGGPDLPAEVATEVDFFLLQLADFLDALAHLGEKRTVYAEECLCSYYGPEPECPSHGQCAYEGHPMDGEKVCHCGGAWLK